MKSPTVSVVFSVSFRILERVKFENTHSSWLLFEHYRLINVRQLLNFHQEQGKNKESWPVFFLSVVI
jgi:hypothetical protein